MKGGTATLWVLGERAFLAEKRVSEGLEVRASLGSLFSSGFFFKKHQGGQYGSWSGERKGLKRKGQKGDKRKDLVERWKDFSFYSHRGII